MSNYENAKNEILSIIEDRQAYLMSDDYAKEYDILLDDDSINWDATVEAFINDYSQLNDVDAEYIKTQDKSEVIENVINEILFHSDYCLNRYISSGYGTKYSLSSFNLGESEEIINLHNMTYLDDEDLNNLVEDINCETDCYIKVIDDNIHAYFNNTDCGVYYDVLPLRLNGLIKKTIDDMRDGII